jgi:hypothetical protein
VLISRYLPKTIRRPLGKVRRKIKARKDFPSARTSLLGRSELGAVEKEMLRKMSLRISIADDMYYSFGENAEAYSSVGLSAMRCGHDTRSLAHYLGHRSLQSTARYTELAEGRFAKFWRD